MDKNVEKTFFDDGNYNNFRETLQTNIYKLV